MNYGMFNKKNLPFSMGVLVMVMCLYLVSGCSIKLKDDDVYEASGNYLYAKVSGSNYLFLDIKDSNFPDECYLDESIIQFQGVKLGTSDMELPASGDSDFFEKKTNWDRTDDGSGSNIEGKWVLTIDDDDDERLEFTFNSDGTFTLEAKNLDCDDYLDTIDDNDDDDDTDPEFTNVGGTWSFTFSDTDDLKIIIDYSLETSNDETFILTRSDGDSDKDWYQWEGTRSGNTFSHYTIENFDYYTPENSDDEEFSPGIYTTKLTFELSTADSFSDGSLSEKWDFDDTAISTVEKTYTITGTKSEQND